MTTPLSPPTRLARRLGAFDAVVVGLGSMIGAGVFAAFGPAARAAGNGLLVGLAIAALVAYCNATSSAKLAAHHPESGGTYVYGRERLGPFWGFLAGWGFVTGKLASCAAMALTFGTYAAPTLARPLAIAAVLALTLVNYLGIGKTVALTKVILAIVLTALAVAVGAVWLGGATEPERLWPLSTSAHGVLESAGFLFFAFAGYARLATLGEEVREPARIIPRAISLALGAALALYAVVAVSLLVALEPAALAESAAPLTTALEAGHLACLSPVVRAGATFASLGALLSLIAGVSRTAFAMASKQDLPRVLSAVHPRYRVPHRAEMAAGTIIALVVTVTDARAAIGFSSFAILTYYGITNAAAWTLEGDGRSVKVLAAGGLAGCAALALALPSSSIIAGTLVTSAGALAYVVRRARKG